MFQSLKPKERIQLSEWAKENFQLSKDYAEDFGLYSYDEHIYQQEILDEIGNPDNKEFVIVGGTQMVKTIALMILLAFLIKEDPGPTLYITYSKEKGSEFSRTRLNPMIRDNAYLNELMSNEKHKMTDAIMMKTFLNGWLAIAGSNSVAGFISSTFRYLLIDEIDSYKLSDEAKGGDKIKLLLKRISEFRNYKVGYTSSPGIKGQSRIMPLFEKTDKRFLFVPCPNCGHYQRLRWGGPKEQYGFKWENNDPKTIYYLCENPKCKAHIPEEEKYGMFLREEWRKTQPEVENFPGFFIPRLYSVTTPWEKFASEFIEATHAVKSGDKSLLQVFVNTTLAELWDPAYGLPEEEELMQRVENYYTDDNQVLPEKVCFLTAFTDVQDSFLHTIIIGWGKNEESWRLKRIIMPGNPALQFVWNELDVLLRKPFSHPLGISLYISAAGIDTGGHHTDQAYAFVKDKSNRRIYGTKGASTPGKSIAPKQPSFNNKGGIPLYLVGTDTAKEVVFSRLRIERDEKLKNDEPWPGYMHFNQDCDQDYFEQLISEKQVKKIYNGLSVPAWVEIPNRRHEDLDCEVGNLAVLRITKPNLLKIDDDLKIKAAKLKEGTLFENEQIIRKQNAPAPKLPKKNFGTSWKD